jgi:hypothetical protein
MNDIDSVALQRIMGANEEFLGPAQDAKEIIKRISRVAERVELSDHEILEALGAPHDALSMKGLYYRTQALIVRYTSTLGGAVLSILGVVALAWLIKRGVQTSLTYIKNGAKLLLSLIPTPKGAVNWFLSFFGLGPIADGYSEVRDVDASPDILLLALSTGLPGPIAGLTQLLSHAFEGAPNPTPPTLPNPSPGTTPILPPLAAAPPVTSPPVGAPPATQPSGTAGEIAAGVQIAGQVLPWLVGLFVDAEVRDEADDVRTAAIIAATHVSPQDPRRIVAIARAIQSQLSSNGNGTAHDQVSELRRARRAAATRW